MASNKKLPKNLNLEPNQQSPKSQDSTPRLKSGSNSKLSQPNVNRSPGGNSNSPKPSPKRYNQASPYNQGYSKPKNEVNKSLLLQIDKQSQNLDQNNIHTVLEYFIKQLKEKVLENQNIPKIKNKKISVNLCLEKNKLCCTSIGMIVDILLQFKDLIKVGILRLHMNCIKDRGASKISQLFKEFRVKEIHLSHNYITEVGLQNMIESVGSSPQYNKKAITPLWMRLEYNIINTEVLVDLLVDNQQMICLVPVRGTRKNQCNIHYCAANNNGTIINIHLPYIKEQKQLLRDLYSTDPNKQDNIEDKLYSLLEKQLGDDDVSSDDELTLEKEVQTNTIISVGTKIESEVITIIDALPSSSTSTEKKTKKDRKKSTKVPRGVPVASNSDPLLIVLDTCSIIQMSNKNSAFSFENLLRHKDNNTLLNIKLILIDTVFQQLDERKKETNNGNERFLIKQFLDNYLIPCREENILHFIHPIELEDEVRARGGHICQRNFRKDNGQFDSDGMILDCIYFLIESSNKRNNIIFLTNDKLCKSRALMNSIPSDSLSPLELSLSKDPLQVIDKNSILSCLSNECLALLQPSNSSSENSFANSSLSRPTLLSELQCAIDITQLLSKYLSLTAPFAPDLQSSITEIQKVANGKTQHWKELLSSHQRVSHVQNNGVDDTSILSREISDLVDKIESLSITNTQ